MQKEHLKACVLFVDGEFSRAKLFRGRPPDLIAGTIQNSCTLRLKVRSLLTFTLKESFEPIKDDAIGGDLIRAMVYGRQIGSHDFHGMHCAVLTVNSSIVSVAVLRVLGCEVAEMPLVATYNQDRGMGYFASLFWCILRTLSDMGIKHFMLPTAADVEAYWRKRFGFRKISRDKLPECTKDLYPMVFEGTSLLI